MPKMIHDLFKLTIAFGCILQVFELEVYLLSLLSLRKNDEQLASIFSSGTFCLNWMTFGFTSEHLVTTFSAVAEVRLRSPLIIALIFQTPLGCFVDP